MFARARTFLIARLALALFVLTQAMAVAAPLAEQPTGQLVCTATGGFQWIVIDPDGAPQPQSAHGMHCPLCTPAGAPPSAHLFVALPQAVPESWLLFARLDAETISAPRAPLPARGPPLHS